MKEKYWHLITEISIDNYVYYELAPSSIEHN